MGPSVLVILATVPLLAVPLSALSATVVHELGHALVAHGLGMRVVSVRFGGGRVLRSGTVRGAAVELRAFAFMRPTGAVHYYLDATKRARLRIACATAAGPVANALLAAPALLVLPPMATVAARFGPATFIALVAWGAMHAAGALVSLVPWSFAKGTQPSDGLRLLRTARMSDEAVAKMVDEGAFYAALHAAIGRGARASREELDRLLGSERIARYGETANFLRYLRASVLVKSGALGEAEAELRGLLAWGTLPLLRGEVRSDLASVLVLLGGPANAAEAAAFAGEAVALDPAKVARRIVHGAALVCAGRRGEGEALVAGELPASEPWVTSVYLRVRAAALEALGRTAEADADRARARTLHPWPC